MSGDLTTKWSAGPDMSMPRSAMGVGVLKNTLLYWYVIGGMSTDGSTLMSVEAFDPLAQTWSGQWPRRPVRSRRATAWGWA